MQNLIKQIFVIKLYFKIACLQFSTILLKGSKDALSYNRKYENKIIIIFLIFPHAKQAFLHSICKSIVDISHCFPKRCELDIIVYVQLYRLIENILMDVSDTLLCFEPCTIQQHNAHFLNRKRIKNYQRSRMFQEIKLIGVEYFRVWDSELINTSLMTLLQGKCIIRLLLLSVVLAACRRMIFKQTQRVYRMLGLPYANDVLRKHSYHHSYHHFQICNLILKRSLIVNLIGKRTHSRSNICPSFDGT